MIFSAHGAAAGSRVGFRDEEHDGSRTMRRAEVALPLGRMDAPSHNMAALGLFGGGLQGLLDSALALGLLGLAILFALWAAVQGNQRRRGD